MIFLRLANKAILRAEPLFRPVNSAETNYVLSIETPVMTTEKYLPQDPPLSSPMVFGYDRATDEKSLAAFLQIIASAPLRETLLPRLADKEIDSILDLFMGLLKKHLSKSEYHQLFLNDSK